MASGMAERVASTPWPLGRFVDRRGRPERWIHQATDLTQDAIRSARDSGSAMLNRTGDQVGDMFERHPLIIGAAGVVAGFLLAALLPATRTEDELMGKARDDLWHKAEETAKQGVTVMREAATRAVDRASDAAIETIDDKLDTKRS